MKQIAYAPKSGIFPYCRASPGFRGGTPSAMLSAYCLHGGFCRGRADDMFRDAL
jgi:hypothetical protein